MGAALLIARSRLRANVTATIVRMVLAGIGGGIVMASLAGIRRADDGWAQLQQDNAGADAVVLFVGPDGQLAATAEDDLDDEMAALLELGKIDAATRFSPVVGVLTGVDGKPFPVAANVYLDAPGTVAIGRPVIVDG